MSALNGHSGKLVIDNPWNITISEWPFEMRIPSRSHPGATRLVNWRLNRCDCPAGRHKKQCRHVKIAKQFALQIWMQVIERMTKSEPGWKLLRDIEGMIEFK